MNWANKVVWITGASTGIGRALAIELHQAGAKVAISARSSGKLDEMVATYGHRLFALPLDVTDKDTIHQALDTLVEHWGSPDLVILNAGACIYVEPGNFNSEIFKKTYDINVLSVTYGIEVLLNHWGSKPGHIAMTGSIAGYTGLPRSTAYGSSKAAIRYIARSLQVDYFRSNKIFTLISPGFVKTPLTDKNDFPMPFIMPPEKAAKIIRKGLEKQKLEIFFPWFFSRFILFIAGLPVGLSRRILSTVRQQKP